MKVALFAAALTLVVGPPGNASWAENANKEYPVFTGTDQALVRAQAKRYYRHSVRHSYYAPRKFYRW